MLRGFRGSRSLPARSLRISRQSSFFGFQDSTLEPTVLRERHHLHVPRDKIFQVVLDVPSYEHFLPYCVGSQITKRINDECFEAILKIGFKGLSASYTSRVTWKENEFVRAQCIDSSVFSSMDSKWTFEDHPQGGTDVKFNMEFTMGSGLLASALKPAIKDTSLKQAKAFEARSLELLKKAERTTKTSTTMRKLSSSGGVETTQPKELSTREAVIKTLRQHCVAQSGNVAFTLPAFEKVCGGLAAHHPTFRRLSQQPLLRRAVFQALLSLHTQLVLPMCVDHEESFDRLAACVHVVVGADQSERAQALFDLMDVNKDRVLQREELANALDQHMQSVASAVQQIIMIGSHKDAVSKMEQELEALERLVEEVRGEIPSAVEQIFGPQGAITFSSWLAALEAHPELVEMMSVKAMEEIAAETTSSTSRTKNSSS